VSQGSILLVEPPEDGRPVYAAFLRDHGFSVTEVDTTDAGLSAAPAADLVITGIRMDGSFDGIELVRRLRSSDRTKDMPLIVLTKCAFEPDQARAFAAGCDVFLPKPCLPETLLAEAACLIERAKQLRTQTNAARQVGGDRRRASQALLEKSQELITHSKRLQKQKHR
jgi:DNA-binding response OmpR family regulator